MCLPKYLNCSSRYGIFWGSGSNQAAVMSCIPPFYQWFYRSMRVGFDNFSFGGSTSSVKKFTATATH